MWLKACYWRWMQASRNLLSSKRSYSFVPSSSLLWGAALHNAFANTNCGLWGWIIYKKRGRQVLMRGLPAFKTVCSWIAWKLQGCSVERLWFCSAFLWVLVHLAMTAEWRWFHTSMPHRARTSCLFVSALAVCRRPICWFFVAYSKARS